MRSARRRARGCEGIATRLFDAHCDTIVKIAEGGADIAAAPGSETAPEVTLEGLHVAGVCAQVFAVFVIEARFPDATQTTALDRVERIRGLCATHPEALALVESGAEGTATIRHACEEVSPSGCGGERGGPPGRGGDGKTAILISLEGADPLEGDPEALREFHRRGVRLVTLAWDDNPFCGAVFGKNGAGAAGLSEKGEELVALCEELDVLVDVSHASDAAFRDVCRVATKPFVASHSDCRGLCAAPRNLSDDMIRALADAGGVMGINLCPSFLSPSFYEAERRATGPLMDAWHAGRLTLDEAGEKAAAVVRSLPRPPLETVVEHVRHAIDVGGEDCVGLGGDLDGVDALPEGIDGVHDYPRLVAALRGAGLTEAQLEKVCYRNLARVFIGG